VLCRKGLQAFCKSPKHPSIVALVNGFYVQVGGAFGATCGLLLMRWLPTWQIQPGLYAMCAAAAMLGGVFRASISLVVIFVESSKVESAL